MSVPAGSLHQHVAPKPPLAPVPLHLVANIRNVEQGAEP